MKIALIQFNATNNKQKNITRIVAFIEEAIQKKSKFILLPEVFSFRGKLSLEVPEDIPGESIKPLMSLAKKHKVFILAGSIYEKSQDIKIKPNVYNTSFLINDQGKIQKKYRKIHLFDAVIDKKNIKESSVFLPGRRGSLTNILNYRVGLSICYDLRFPQMYQKYSRLGVDILCVPAAFTRQTGKAHWEVLLRARAIENTCYVLAPNQIGKDSRGIQSHGHSMVIDPWGKILSEASGNKEEIIYAQVDQSVIKEKRMILGGTVYE